METIAVSPTLEIPKNMKLISFLYQEENGAARSDLAALILDLVNENDWAVRQAAARQLGQIGTATALANLLEALARDPFWMVRSAIIQAVEKIGDARAIPALKDVANTDSFAVVRAYATKAIVRLLAS